MNFYVNGILNEREHFSLKATVQLPFIKSLFCKFSYNVVCSLLQLTKILLEILGKI